MSEQKRNYGVIAEYNPLQNTILFITGTLIILHKPGVRGPTAWSRS